jgi:SAM-dependent methyltransferase
MISEFYVRNPYPMVGNHNDYYDRDLRHVFEPFAPRRVLDAGCGTGAISCDIARHFPGASILGVDGSEPAIRLARERHGDMANVTFEVADIERQVPHSGFDFVFCQGVLHHLRQPARALRNIYAAGTDDMTAYVWLYSAHGRHEVSIVRTLEHLLAGPGHPEEERLATIELLRPLFHDLFEADANDLKDWVSTDPAWTRADEHRSRQVDRYLNPFAEHYSVREANELFAAAGFDIVSVPTLDAVPLPPAVAELVSDRGLDLISRYAVAEMVIRPGGIGYLLRKRIHQR